MSASPTVYLVTGANRGIGFNLVQQLSARSNVVVYAGARSLPSADSELGQLAAKLPNVVIPLVINSGNEEDNAAAAELVKSKAGKLDVLVANAGVYSGVVPISKVTPSMLRSDHEVNTIGPLVLFNAFSSVLEAADSPKFVVISTAAAQITEPVPFAVNSYGASKAASNFLTVKINVEYPKITAFPIHPGMVTTDMGNKGLKDFGVTAEQVGAVTPTASAEGLLTVIDKADKESYGGKFWSFDGSELKY